MIHILHLSDIHLGTLNQAHQYRVQLETDLKKQLKINKLEYLVISGDIANYSTSEDYEAALELVNNLGKGFDLDSKKIIVVPGNHDLNWELSENAYHFVSKRKLPDPLPEGRYREAGDEGVLLRDEQLYQKRFDYFNSFFYKRMYGKEYPTEYKKQGILHTYPNDRIVFLALNSCWEIDRYYHDRAGVNMDALYHSLNHFIDGKYDGWIKFAVCHHPIAGSEMMKNVEFMEQLAVHGFQIVIHGHIHEAIEGYHKYDDSRGIHIIGAGTFGAPVKEKVSGIPLQYNLLKLDPNTSSITVETRKKEKPDGAWSADARWGEKNDPKPRYLIELTRQSCEQNDEMRLKQENEKNLDVKQLPNGQHDIKVNLPGLLKLLGGNIYTEPGAAIREMIQNAHDTCILRMSKDEGFINPQIHVTHDKYKKLLMVSDNGSGMTERELHDYLSTIGKSYTKLQEENLRGHGAQEALLLIGQFGVGILSAFSVAEKVVIFTQSYKSLSSGFKWTCTGDTHYFVEQAGVLQTGTKVIMHLTDKNLILLDNNLLNEIIKKYADFLSIPIYLNEKQVNSCIQPWIKDFQQMNDNEKQMVSINGYNSFWITENSRTDYSEYLTKRYNLVPLAFLAFQFTNSLSLDGLLFIPSVFSEMTRNFGEVDIYIPSLPLVAVTY